MLWIFARPSIAAATVASRPVRHVLRILALFTLLKTAAAAPGEGDILFYAPLDGTTDIFLPINNGFIRSSFSRDGTAYAPDFSRAERHEPRFVEGRFGRGLYLEAGDYGNYPRGTRNNLPPASSHAAGFPDGFVLTGNARGDLDGNGLTGQSAIKVSAAAGSGIETQRANLPVAMQYIASVYLKSDQENATVRMVLEDLTHKVTVDAELELTGTWERYDVRLPYNEREKTFGEKELTEPIEVVLRVVSGDGVPFYLDALMIEQTGIHYSSRQAPSTWIKGGNARREENFTIPLLPETFNPAQGTIAFWMKYEPGNVRRTLFSIGGGWSPPLLLTADNRGFVYNYFGAGRTAGIEENNEWRFVAISWENNTSKVFLDGEKIIGVEAERGFVDEDPWGRNMALAPGSAQGGTRTHINGVMDEIYSFNRSLNADELATLMTRGTDVVSLPPVVPAYAMPVWAFARDMKTAPLRFRMVNTSGENFNPVQVHFAVEGFPEISRTATLTLAAHAAEEIVYEFPVEKFSVGGYQVNISTTVNDETTSTFFPVRVGPYRNPEQLPILAWNAGAASRDRVRQMRDLGVTVITGTGQRIVDWATETGIYTEARLTLRGDARPHVKEDRIMGNDGVFRSVNPRSEHVTRSVRDDARAYAASLADKDTVRFSIVNTEWHIGMDFSPAMQDLVKEKFDLDLSRWITEPRNAWSYLHPLNRLRSTLLGDDGSPPGGVVDVETDNFYQFHRWWHQGAANEQIINRICMEEIKRVRPDVQTVIEPILRRPSVKVYGHNTDIAQEWFYFENPRVAIRIQEQLTAMTRGTSMRPSGMPQFLFKSAPFAATPPPDMLREAIWLCASRPLAMMSFWGWHRVLDQGNMFLIEDVEEKFAGLTPAEVRERRGELGGEGQGLFIPEVKDTFAEISRTLWEPYGSLMMKWENAPRHVAMLDSFASQVYSNVRWHFLGWLGDAMTASGVPYDVLYDEDFLERKDALAGYKIVALPSAYAITSKAHQSLRDFVAGGGVVIADDVCRVEGIPNPRRFSADDRNEVVGLLRAESGLPVTVETDDVIWNILSYAGVNYLVVVNDKRVSGRYLGQWGPVLDEGVAQNVTVKVQEPLGAHVIDLTSSAVMPTTSDAGWNRFSFELGPTDGKIFMLVDSLPETLEAASAQSAFAPGETADVTVVLNTAAAEPIRGGVPIHLKMLQPNGEAFDLSGYRLMENGKHHLAFVVPVNAEPGTWRLQVRELATGKTAETEWQVADGGGEQAARHGEWREHYDTGEIQRTGRYLQGREHGRWVSYRRDGTPESEQTFENGALRSGKRFYEDGTLAEEIRYVDGRVLFTVFDHDGQVVGSD